MTNKYRQTKEISGDSFALMQYVRTIFPNKGGKKGELPGVILKKENMTINASKVAAYRKECGFPADSESVPATYLFVLAFPLHLELLLQKDFPYTIMGLVHVNNTITQYKKLSVKDTLTMEVYFDDLRQHDKGVLIPIITKAYRLGELVWECRTESLKFIKKEEGDKSKKKEGSPVMDGQTEQWKLDTFAGIRYSRIAGDINPIHIMPLTAKLFGFQRHIIHGMWTKARTLAAIEAHKEDKPFRLHVDFKLPVYLPATITLNWAKRSGGIDFEVRDKWNEKPHLKGDLTYL